jgi:hypothetical protein
MGVIHLLFFNLKPFTTMEVLNKKIKNALYSLVIIGMMGSISACDNNRTTDSANTNDTEMRNDALENDAEVMDMDENAWMQKRDDFVTEQRDLSMKMENAIAAQERELEGVSDKSSAAINESIKSLKIKKKNLDDKLDEVSQASRENWQDTRNDISEASTELQKSWEAFEKEYNVKEQSNR